jgi:hypothetical protein
MDVMAGGRWVIPFRAAIKAIFPKTVGTGRRERLAGNCFEGSVKKFQICKDTKSK